VPLFISAQLLGAIVGHFIADFLVKREADPTDG
jgi:glycerol uptake facilitator-like aquaporin